MANLTLYRNIVGDFVRPAGGQFCFGTLNGLQANNLNEPIGARMQVYFQVGAGLGARPVAAPALARRSVIHLETAVGAKAVGHRPAAPSRLREWVNRFGGALPTTGGQPQQHKKEGSHRCDRQNVVGIAIRGSCRCVSINRAAAIRARLTASTSTVQARARVTVSGADCRYGCMIERVLR